MLDREFKAFSKYYDRLQKFILKKGIYYSERPFHRYDFVILEDFFDDKNDSELDDIIEDMYGNHVDIITEVPIFGALVMSSDFISHRNLPLADDFFKQNERPKLIWSDILSAVVSGIGNLLPVEDLFKQTENLEQTYSKITNTTIDDNRKYNFSNTEPIFKEIQTDIQPLYRNERKDSDFSKPNFLIGKCEYYAV